VTELDTQTVTVRIERDGRKVEATQEFYAWVTATSDVAGVAYEIAVNLNESLLRATKEGGGIVG
jgi:hypothetical protein